MFNPDINLLVVDAAKKFGWSTNTTRIMLNFGSSVCAEVPDWKQQPEDQTYEVWNKHIILLERTHVTIRHVLQSLDEKTEKDSRVRRRDRHLIGYLARAGFTRLDSISMPATTVNVEKLKSFSKEEIKKLDVLVLGTLSYIARDHIIERFRLYPEYEALRTPGKLSIGALCMLTEWYYTEKYCKRSVQKTRRTLLALGFGPADGPFLTKEVETEVSLIDDLMAQEGLTAQEAKRVVNIAVRRNWV